MLRRYVHGSAAGIDDPLAWYAGAAVDDEEALHFLHADRLGSIVLSTDRTGHGQTFFRYDEYGTPQADNTIALTPENGARFLFTGQAFLPDAGLYYYKARMYSPTLGRFMQTDPIGYEDQMNLYAYVANDPINSVDPDGHEAFCVSQPSACGTSEPVSAEEQKVRKTAFEITSSLIPIGGIFQGIRWAGRGAWVAVNESMSARALAFQISQGGRSGMAYLLNGVKFDARIGRTLIEAKSSLANFVGKDGAFRSWFKGADALVSQAQRQLTAAKGLNVTWKVQDAKTAGAINRLFKRNGVEGIKVEVAKTVCTGSRIARSGGC